MNKIILTILFLINFFHFNLLFSQNKSKPTYVIVHGAWGGGWAFKKVDSLLTDSGFNVYRPTLTGQGERAHLASKDIGLDTHIKDVINTIFYENIENITLIGHSYGGMVITGVADAIPERITKLIYLDAYLPDDNESLLSIRNKNNRKTLKIKNGFIIPDWVPKYKSPPKDVPQSYKTWTDTLHLKNPERLKIPTIYILTVKKDSNYKNDDFASQAKRANKKGWPIFQLEADHNPQWSAPFKLVGMLEEIGQ